MKNFKKIISLGLVLVLLLAVGCTGKTEVNSDAKGDKHKFDLAIDSPEDTVTYLFAEQFKKLLEEKSNGDIEVNLYSNGQLGGDREIAESVQSGNIAFVIQNTAPQVNFIPSLAVFDMPSVFPDPATARKALDSQFFEEVGKEYEEAGFKLLALADQGFRAMSSNKKVTSMADFKGQKIRTMENPYHIEYWKALGANPTPMAWAEVYVGLQQGTIDAQENPFEVIVSAKLYEQQKYVINTQHILHLLSLITNPTTFDGLSAEHQKAVIEAASESKDWARNKADERVADRIKIMEDNGVEIIDLDAAVLDEMGVSAEVVYQTIRKNIGDNLVDSLLNAVKESK